ncbi:beta-lactamase family protein [Massilia sp. IC2-477]|uniref:serine hydrolase domain-containing protein n=1 Tax=Massilia sp. IC2-477 TaxID=2887198 RepID=UPI001D11FE52|nr:serine hydrolase domain-containing protein [Massilia sp. IC2-477]MCC2957452.1 beta-lactamase family protein [Massilia sp. IC2-477]
MTSTFFRSFLVSCLLLTGCATGDSGHALDKYVVQGMRETGAQGLAIAVVRGGVVTRVATWGKRNARGEPLTPDTVMYGASLTKAVFAYTVMQLVEEGRLDLDTSIAAYLPKALPEYAGEAGRYAAWQHLAGDERWRKLTPRILLTHSAGFSNFGFLEPDGKLKFHFDPGSRYAYSGDGLILLQFVIERGLGLDLGKEMQRRVFDRFGMKRTSMTWRPDFATNLADGWKEDGSVEAHDERSKTRAAGSMDTTIRDFAEFAAAYVRGDGLQPGSRAELTRPQLPILTASQFPSLQAIAPPERRHRDLTAGLGVITFDGPQGRGFQKGGHNDSTGNTWVCLERQQSCVVILSNDVRAEPLFPEIVRLILGETGMPWSWEYGPRSWARP